MQHSTLIQILRQLETRERSRFEELVFSPFFNKNEKVRRLCTYVLRFAPDFDHSSLEKPEVYKHVFESEEVEELRLNNVISDLLQLLYDFLAFQQYEQREQWQKHFLLEELLEREIYRPVKRAVRRYEQLQAQTPFRNYDFFQQEYARFEIRDRLHLTKGKRSFDANLQQKSDTLDLYYFCNKLRIACDMLSRNTVVNAGYECHFLEDILQKYEDNHLNFQHEPALTVYYKTLQMLRESGDSSHFFDVKRLLQAHFELFPQAELRILYSYALNHCVKKINFGESRYYREILDLYKILLEQRIIFKNNSLTQWTFTNIVTAGLRLQEYDWTSQFIHEYAEMLPEEERHNAVTYNLAALYYDQGQYDRALQQLQDVEFTHAFYHIAAKIVQLKIYYELEETEAFLALAEATRKYLKRNRDLSDYQVQSNSNFLKLTQKLYQLHLKDGYISASDFQKHWQALAKSIKTTEPIANKDWVEGRLEVLVAQ